MRRRDLIGAIGSAAAVWPLAARAQQGERMRRIGVLMGAVANGPEGQARIAAKLRTIDASVRSRVVALLRNTNDLR